MRYNIL